jgi:hypothetical protein
MARNLTDPNSDGTLEWQERVVDVDGDSISIDLILDQVNGSNATNSNPSWLGFTTTTNTINTDETEVLVDITADTSGLSEGYTYTFEITADDGITTTTRTFQLEVTEPPPAFPGSRFYSVDISNDLVREYGMTTNFDVSTASSTGATHDTGPSGPYDEESTPVGVCFGPDGVNMFVTGSISINGIHSYNLNTAWDLSTVQSPTSVDFANGNPQGVQVKPDGTKIFHATGSGEVLEYTMTTAFDITTASLTNTFTNGQSLVFDIHLREDGTRMFYIANDGFVYRFDLSTAWDTTSASQVQTFDHTGQETDPDGVALNNDGSKLFILGTNNGVGEYDLSTAWDLSTASYVDSFSHGIDNPKGLFFGGP